MTRGSSRREQQGGFALLMIFVMAAGIALMLYSQLPRTAFESVRGREELLVDHAHEYERAIQLYVAQFHAYPASMDDLEKANNKRFLRRKFKDPFTGKDDWRIIHVDNMGKLTDSLIEKKEEKKPNLNTFITEMPGIGQTSTDLDAGGVNVALRKRPSEGSAGENAAPPPLPPPQSSAPAPVQNAVPNPLINSAPNQQPQNQAGINPNAPGGPNAPTGSIAPGNAPVQGGALPAPQNPQTFQQAYPNGVPQYAGQVNSGVFPPGANQQLPQLRQNPTQTPASSQQYSGTIVAGQSIGASAPAPQPTQHPVPGQFQQGTPGAGMAPTYGNNVATQPGRPGFSGGAGPGTPQAALSAIQQALMQPSGANMPMNMGPGMQIRGGIAGIAPKGHDGPSIKIVAEQINYKKWEFVYDMRKDKRMQQALGQAQAQLPNQIPGPNSPAGSGFGSQTGPGSQTGLASQTGAGSQTGIGSQPGIGFQPGLGQQQGFGQQPPGFGQQQRPAVGQQPGVVQAQPGLGQPQPGIGQQQPGIGQQQPGAGQQQPGAGQQQPGAGQQQPGVVQPGTASPPSDPNQNVAPAQPSPTPAPGR